MNQTAKHHYHLITGEIVFRVKSSADVNATRVNGILADEGKQLPVRLLAKSQQILQINFMRSMAGQEENIEILDCILFNHTYLGEFTQDEFHQEPAGTVLQERPTSAPTLIRMVPRTEEGVIEVGVPAVDVVK